MAPRDDDRPKRSWKEIDQAKTLGKKPKDDGGSAPSGGPNRYAYNSYKNQLNRLFDQGGMGALTSPEGAAGPMAQRQAEQALLQHKTPKAFATAVRAYIDEHGLPKDPAVLMACFDLTDESLVMQALTAVQALLDAGTIKRLQALRSRLNTLVLSHDAPKILASAKAMLAQLAAR